jgi:hypothetical protein
MIRPDPFGILDVVAAVFLFFTVSPLPVIFAHIHAGFLAFKGVGSMIEAIPLPIPVYILGNGADLISAAILMTGQPPILGEFKIWIAGFLFLKGLWGSLGMMGGMS